MRVPLLLSVTLAVLVLVCPVTAAPNGDAPLADYGVTTWNEGEGLPAGRILGLAQDANGYLWLAAEGGLTRFDGIKFEAWASRVEPHVPAGSVVAIASARDGSLWVGKAGRTPVGRIRGGTLTMYGAPQGLEATYAMSLAEDHAGTIWAGTAQGLFAFRGERWRKIGSDEGLEAGSVLSVFEDREHRLWVGTTTKVYRRDGDGRFVQVDKLGTSSLVWQNFSQDASGTVWVSDYDEGFRQLGGVASRTPRRGLGVRLLHDRRGNLWVGTQAQGLWRVRPSDRNTGLAVQTITVDDGLVSNGVQSLLEDREGNLWVGTLSGLQRLSPHRVTPIRDLATPRAVATTPDGSVWAGTSTGLTRISPRGRRDYTEADGLPGAQVIALHTDSDGTLWIATERGVSRFATERFSAPLVRPGSFIQRVVNIASSDEGLWLRDFGLRVYRWKGGAVSPVEDLPDAYRSTAFAVFTDRDGRLWIGSGDGTVGVRQRTGEFRSYEPRVGRIVCFAQDADGGVWVGGDEGLTRFANDTLTIVAPRNGLLGGVKSIVEDEDGVMWVGAGTGIFRIEKSEIARVALDPLYRLRSQFFNGTDGVAGVPFAEGSGTAVRSKDGRLWFATSSGLTLIDPRHTGDRRASPAPLIESVTADARAFDMSAPLRLPAGTAHLQIAFNALTLSDPFRVRFRYRLEGFDRDWIDAGVSRQATYTNLPPRQYRFLVSVTNGDGAWSEPRAPLALVIAPRFYQTRWFAALCAFTVFALVYAAWRLRVRQVRRQFSLVLAERIRMSRAIHDTLLQGLAALALQVDDLSHHLDTPTADSKRRVLGIRQQVEEYIRQARTSIWDLRSPILAARDLPRALRHTAELAVAGGPLELDMTVTGKPRGESAAVDEQLLLIAQEAVNNAVQHSRARHVAVALDYGDEAVHLRVSDDGCGFDPASPAAGHYGLISMRERAEQVHGQLSIVSAPGAGTRVETIVPTP